MQQREHRAGRCPVKLGRRGASLRRTRRPGRPAQRSKSMSIYDQTELLDAVKNWKDAGLPFNEWSHPSVVLNSPAYWLLRQLLKQSSSVEAPVEAEPSGPADP